MDLYVGTFARYYGKKSYQVAKFSSENRVPMLMYY